MGRQHGMLLREVGGYEAVLDYYPRMLDIFVGGERGGVPEALLRPFVGWALRRLERRRPRDLRERTLAFFEALGYPAARARDLFYRYLPLIRYEGQPVIGLAIRKEILRRRGVIASAAIRHPGPTLDAGSRAELDEILARLGLADAGARPVVVAAASVQS
jgi:hypothetical protein